MSLTGLLKKQSLTCQNTVDRREAPRFCASQLPTLKSVSVVGGPELKLINISRHGALIESRECMPRRSRIFLRCVIQEKIYIIKGRIARCSSCPTIEKAPNYKCAIAFDEDFTILHALLR